MASSQRRPGVMVVHFDIPEELEGEFNAWYDEEHVPDKVGKIPGFIRARRYVTAGTGPQYLCIYELEDIGVLDDPTYMAGYRDGSEATKRMKAKARTFVRTVYVQITDTHGIPLDDRPVS